jgi:hypothetical protein
MQNIKLTYLYRDAGNYKTWGEVVFSNPIGLTPIEVTCKLEQVSPDGLFIADQVRLPELLPYLTGNLSPDDHCFHEFDRVEVTADGPSDHLGRPISEFLSEAHREAQSGWRASDPHDKLQAGSAQPQHVGDPG